MTAATRDDVPVALGGEGVEVRNMPIGGGMSISYITLPQGTDMGPALKGLPDDACQCPHWGYLLKGRIRMRTATGEEEYEAGQAYYWGPGHVPLALADTELVEFSPDADFKQVIDHVVAQAG
ncbi:MULTISPECIES: hypothetical protein [Streptomyces]|uniref:hypothetical protein n=1 Tax=Streptomyces TaxID=1883 RepID=UPI000CF21DBF|nr:MULTISPECIES: hypothetical protein [Streptomyces]PPS74432.1 hypothetical protein BV882_12370 [Streptomyces sp. 46]